MIRATCKSKLTISGVLILIFVIGITDSQVYGQTETNQLNVTTDKSSYQLNDSIWVIINNFNYVPNLPLTWQVLDPSGHQVAIGQEEHIFQNGVYEFKIITSAPLWNSDGTYTVTIQYGHDVTGQTTFSFNTMPSHQIPSWIKNIFVWYGQGKISNDDLLVAIKFLVDSGIIQLQSK